MGNADISATTHVRHTEQRIAIRLSRCVLLPHGYRTFLVVLVIWIHCGTFWNPRQQVVLTLRFHPIFTVWFCQPSSLCTRCDLCPALSQYAVDQYQFQRVPL